MAPDTEIRLAVIAVQFESKLRAEVEDFIQASQGTLPPHEVKAICLAVVDRLAARIIADAVEFDPLRVDKALMTHTRNTLTFIQNILRFKQGMKSSGFED